MVVIAIVLVNNKLDGAVVEKPTFPANLGVLSCVIKELIMSGKPTNMPASPITNIHIQVENIVLKFALITTNLIII